MATKTKTSGSGGLSAFANSPLGSRLFSWLIALLVLAAAIYGGYAIYRQNFSHAASGDHTSATYPLYDLYKPGPLGTTFNSPHFYTAFKCEKDYFVNNKNWKYYDIAGYVQISTSRPKICDHHPLPE